MTEEGCLNEQSSLPEAIQCFPSDSGRLLLSSEKSLTSGNTRSPSFLTKSPRVLAATFLLSGLSLARQPSRRVMSVGRISRRVRAVLVTTTFQTWRAVCRTIRATSDLEWEWNYETV